MTGLGGAEPEQGRSGPTDRRWRVQPLSVLFLVLGLALTAGLTAWSQLSYLHSEYGLTKLDLRLAGSSIQSTPTDIEHRLADATTAVVSSGRPALFSDVLGSAIGARGTLVGAELFKLYKARLHLEASLGASPIGGRTGPRTLVVARQAADSHRLVVDRLTSGSIQQLAYALSLRSPAGQYIAYADQALPSSRHGPIPKTSPTGVFYYALYYGKDQDRKDLLVTDAPSLPLQGTVAATRIVFGSARLLLVASPINVLGGDFSEFVPWGILGTGIILSLAGLLLVEWVMRRRLLAESLAVENRRLYEAQRSVAETLQRSFLPIVLPARPGVTIAARYLPGTAGIEVGGDWYDVVEVDARQLFFTVGDVAGRGLDAAILMSALRTAMWAYATDGDEPAAVLEKLGRLVDVGRDGRFATVLCGVLDTETGDGILVSAGHPPPAVAAPGGCSILEIQTGPPIGIGDTYQATLFSLREGETLIGYTDGLVERRHEAVTEGILRLCQAVDPSLAPEPLLERLVERLIKDEQADDVAILAIRREVRR